MNKRAFENDYIHARMILYVMWRHDDPESFRCREHARSTGPRVCICTCMYGYARSALSAEKMIDAWSRTTTPSVSRARVKGQSFRISNLHCACTMYEERVCTYTYSAAINHLFIFLSFFGRRFILFFYVYINNALRYDLYVRFWLFASPRLCARVAMTTEIFAHEDVPIYYV